MYYDYPEEDFYTESEYQEQIDALKEAVRDSVKSGILEEMNRLRAENEKLQDVKKHIKEIEDDCKKKKYECDRIVSEAEENAKKKRLSELMEGHNVIKWKIGYENVYGPKCEKCDNQRQIKVKLPSGKKVYDNCSCDTKSKEYYYPDPYEMVKFRESSNGKEVVAYYTKTDSEEYILESWYPCDDTTQKQREEAVKTLDKNVRRIFFETAEECKEVCDRLNEKQGIGNYMYMRNGRDIREVVEKRMKLEECNE